MRPAEQPAAEQKSASRRRLTVPAAADALGVTSDAVRGRIKRGTLASTKDEDGTVYVFLPREPSETTGDQPHDQSDSQPHGQSSANHQPAADGLDQSDLVEALRDQVGYLRQQLEVWQEESRRKDHLLAALTERIPELPAPETPREARDSDLTASEEPGGTRRGHPVSQEPEQHRSWLYRFFFGP
jgi:hypothetical protein